MHEHAVIALRIVERPAGEAQVHARIGADGRQCADDRRGVGGWLVHASGLAIDPSAPLEETVLRTESVG